MSVTSPAPLDQTAKIFFKISEFTNRSFLYCHLSLALVIPLTLTPKISSNSPRTATVGFGDLEVQVPHVGAALKQREPACQRGSRLAGGLLSPLGVRTPVTLQLQPRLPLHCDAAALRGATTRGASTTRARDALQDSEVRGISMPKTSLLKPLHNFQS